MKGRIGEHQRYGRHTNQCNDGNPKEWFEMFEYSHEVYANFAAPRLASSSAFSFSGCPAWPFTQVQRTSCC